jgi:exosortase C (VPDSG-CTERM-specific)
MNRPQERLDGHMTANEAEPVQGWKMRARKLSLATAILVVCFILPLVDLVRFALQNDLYSHIVLIPLISIYLVWEKRRAVPLRFLPATVPALVAGILGAVFLAAYWIAALNGSEMAREDSLAITTLAFLLFFAGLCLLLLGRETVRSVAFPLGFLVFMVPLPLFVADWIVLELQRGSALAADAMFNLAGTPVVFQGLRFQLQDITLEVAPQCSGIHSTLAIFITSVLAAYLFLRSPWKGVLLTLAVIPLAIVRNGFRIFTIGELCVHIGPQMINSYIHHHGGPIFFTLSLVPFFLLLYLLSRGDRRGPPAPKPVSN